MSPMLGGRRRAEELESVLAGRLPADQAPAEVGALATLASALRGQAPVEPRDGFSASLRERLMAEAATVLREDSSTLALPAIGTGSRRRKVVASATAAVVLVGGTAGMAAAAQNAMPGDLLYPLKRTIERADASLNTSDAGKGRDLLEQARGRL